MLKNVKAPKATALNSTQALWCLGGESFGCACVGRPTCGNEELMSSWCLCCLNLKRWHNWGANSACSKSCLDGYSHKLGSTPTWFAKSWAANLQIISMPTVANHANPVWPSKDATLALLRSTLVQTSLYLTWFQPRLFKHLSKRLGQRYTKMNLGWIPSFLSSCCVVIQRWLTARFGDILIETACGREISTHIPLHVSHVPQQFLRFGQSSRTNLHENEENICFLAPQDEASACFGMRVMFVDFSAHWLPVAPTSTELPPPFARPRTSRKSTPHWDADLSNKSSQQIQDASRLVSLKSTPWFVLRSNHTVHA
jgi:hypothetical protein